MSRLPTAQQLYGDTDIRRVTDEELEYRLSFHLVNTGQMMLALGAIQSGLFEIKNSDDLRMIAERLRRTEDMLEHRLDEVFVEERTRRIAPPRTTNLRPVPVHQRSEEPNADLTYGKEPFLKAYICAIRQRLNSSGTVDLVFASHIMRPEHRDENGVLSISVEIAEQAGQYSFMVASIYQMLFARFPEHLCRGQKPEINEDKICEEVGHYLAYAFSGKIGNPEYNAFCDTISLVKEWIEKANE